MARDPAWPIAALLAGWPLWWALGIGEYTPVVIAIPIVRRMYQWRATRSRQIRVPPGFGLWALFLLVMLAGVTMVSQEAAQTIPTPVSHRVASWALKALLYLSCTVILLYAGNLTEQELPRKRLAWLLGLLAVYTIGGGMAGLIAPSFTFTSPLAHVVPQSIQNADTVLGNALHPALVQKQSFQGHGRPSAPFNYSNGWGNNLAILLPWLLVGWRVYGTPRQRRIATAVLVIAVVPIILSYNRGLWIGLVLGAFYLAVRLAAQGRGATLRVLIGVVLVVAVVIVASPLKDLIAQRISNGSSNTGRLNLASLATHDSLDSPMLGYGDSRHERGSAASIAVGRSSSCRSCGNADIGAHGQLWLLLFSTGWPGTFFYLSFFGYGIWRYRRDTTAYGMAGVLVLLLGFVFMFVYQQVGANLSFTVLAYALLWKNDRELRSQPTALAGADGQAIQADSGLHGITAGAPIGMLARGRG
jgi:hypothetical protein